MVFSINNQHRYKAKNLHVTHQPKSYERESYTHITDINNIDWNRIGSSATILLQQQIDELADYFTLVSTKDAIQDFLGVYTDSLLMFLEIHHKLLHYFSDIDLYLQVDTHIKDTRYYEAIVYIETSLPYKEARQKLKSFDQDWWLDIYSQTGIPITIAIR